MAAGVLEEGRRCRRRLRPHLGADAAVRLGTARRRARVGAGRSVGGRSRRPMGARRDAGLPFRASPSACHTRDAARSLVCGRIFVIEHPRGGRTAREVPAVAITPSWSGPSAGIGQTSWLFLPRSDRIGSRSVSSTPAICTRSSDGDSVARPGSVDGSPGRKSVSTSSPARTSTSCRRSMPCSSSDQSCGDASSLISRGSEPGRSRRVERDHRRSAARVSRASARGVADAFR